MNQLEFPALNASGHGLVLRCVRSADRWAHTIGLQTGDSYLPLLASHEGTPHDDWPPSPPLQEVHQQQQENSRLMLGVGGAGSGHWSLSVEAPNAIARLTFDVACRVSVAPAHLGSAYRTMLAGERGRSLHDVIFTTQFGQVALRALPLPEGATADVEITPQGIAVLPALAAGEWPASLRWRYVVELLETA